MPPGTVTDPDNNPKENRFGILLDHESGHFMPYLKEDDSDGFYEYEIGTGKVKAKNKVPKESRYFPANTPVWFEKETFTCRKGSESYDIEIAIDVKHDKKRISNTPMIDKYIELAKKKLGKYKIKKYQKYDSSEISDIMNENENI